MPETARNHLQEASPQPRIPRLHAFFQTLQWLQSPWFGYLASFLLIGGVLLIEKIDEALPQASVFIGTPFALASILIALIWGLGPALLTIALGMITLIYFIPTQSFTSDILNDIRVSGPFIIGQLIAVVAVVRLEHFNRKLKVAYQKLLAAYQALEATQQQLSQNHKQLERANKLKDYIIMRASHELRTPLTTIMGRTQLLSARLQKSGETPENWSALHKYLDIVNMRGNQLRSLIESLFNLSRIQSRNIPLRQQIQDFGVLCRNVIKDQQDQSGRVIELAFPTHAIMLHMNEELLSQVLVNLVRNAINYSPVASPIHVCVCSNENQVMLRVYNEGTALSPEQLEHLFEPFYRAPEVEYSALPGWGLGLTTSKEIVEQYKGEIWAESSEGTGVAFFVKLPLHPEDGEARGQNGA